MNKLFRTKLVRAVIVAFCIDASVCSGTTYPIEGSIDVNLPAGFVAITNAASISRYPVLVDCRMPDRRCPVDNYRSRSSVCHLFETAEWNNWAATNLYCFKLIVYSREELEFFRKSIREAEQPGSKENFDFSPNHLTIQDADLALAKVANELGVTSGIGRIVLGPDGNQLGSIIANPDNEPYEFVSELCMVAGLDPPDKAMWPGGEKWFHEQERKQAESDAIAKKKTRRNKLLGFVSLVGGAMFASGWKAYKASATIENPHRRRIRIIGAIGLMFVAVVLVLGSGALKSTEEYEPPGR